MNLIDRIKCIPSGISAITEWLGDGAEVVDVATAQRRADICLRCPKNVSSPVTESAALAIKRLLEIKKSLALRVQGEKSLLTCDVCGCALRLKVWVSDAKVRGEIEANGDRERYPDFCWQTKT